MGRRGPKPSGKTVDDMPAAKRSDLLNDIDRRGDLTPKDLFKLHDVFVHYIHWTWFESYVKRRRDEKGVKYTAGESPDDVKKMTMQELLDDIERSALEKTRADLHSGSPKFTSVVSALKVTGERRFKQRVLEITEAVEARNKEEYEAEKQQAIDRVQQGIGKSKNPEDAIRAMREAFGMDA